MPASAVAIVSIAISAYVLNPLPPPPLHGITHNPPNTQVLTRPPRRIAINRFQNRRILIVILFILPSIAGNVLLWKASRTNKGALLAGLYMVRTLHNIL